MFFFFRKNSLFYNKIIPVINHMKPMNVPKRMMNTANPNHPPSGDDLIMFVSCIALAIYYYWKKPPNGRISFV